MSETFEEWFFENGELLLAIPNSSALEKAWNHQQKKIEALTSQLEVLTKCECGDLYQEPEMRKYFICQGCKNKKQLEEEE